MANIDDKVNVPLTLDESATLIAVIDVTMPKFQGHMEMANLLTSARDKLLAALGDLGSEIPIG